MRRPTLPGDAGEVYPIPSTGKRLERGEAAFKAREIQRVRPLERELR